MCVMFEKVLLNMQHHLHFYPTVLNIRYSQVTAFDFGLSDRWKIRKVNNFLGGSGHPNFMNPFEYDKQLPDKSFPKRIGTLTKT